MLNHVGTCVEGSTCRCLDGERECQETITDNSARVDNLGCNISKEPNKSHIDSTLNAHERNHVKRTTPRMVRAKADFKCSCESELSFERGDWLTVLRSDDVHWWWCRFNGVEGYAPTNHLTLNTDAEEDDEISWQDDIYFGRYSEIQFHLEMLLDKARTNAYRNAIQNNKHSLTGKVVLDVGCGSGILSMLCARDGNAGHVYAVDASSMVNLASRAIIQNGLGDKTTVIYGKIEEITLPRHSKVDLIISEWMGTLLISECMIESVIIARDMFLKEGGKMWPSTATLYLAPCTANSSYEKVSLDLWDEMYDFDFSAFKVEASNELLDKPLHKHVATVEDILAEPHVVLNMSLATVTLSDIEKVESEFKFVIRRSGTLHGFCTWFTVDFDPLWDDDKTEKSVTLNTGPSHPNTHWNHPLLALNYPLKVEKDMVVKGKVILTRHPLLRRHVRLKLTGDVISSENNSEIIVAKFCKEFKCWQ